MVVYLSNPLLPFQKENQFYSSIFPYIISIVYINIKHTTKYDLFGIKLKVSSKVTVYNVHYKLQNTFKDILLLNHIID